MDHVETTRRAYAAINAGDIDALGGLLSEDFVDNEELPGLAPTREGVVQFFKMFLAAFPDLRMEPEDLLPSGDKVVIRARVTGTHQGEFMGVPATGRGIETNVIDIMRFEDDGLVHEHWGVFDVMTMMQQIGAVPSGPPA